MWHCIMFHLLCMQYRYVKHEKVTKQLKLKRLCRCVVCNVISHNLKKTKLQLTA